MPCGQLKEEMQSMTNLTESEQMIQEYIAKGDTDGAVKLLYEMIVQCAKAKKFSKAEEFRERILEIDPMALNEIINSAEIIEEEKSQALDPIHMEIWSKLYDTLSTEEKNAVFFAMKDAAYGINETVFLQGNLNSNLYFINSGELKVIYRHQDGEVLLNTLGSGQIAGQDNFFSNTVCTTSLITSTKVNLKYLEKSDLLEWQKEFPNLEQRLREFCAGFQNVTELIKRKKMDRRSLKRIKISGIGLIKILNKAGVPLAKSFKGELSDISIGGLSFEIRITKEETARLLIGRKINVEFIFSKSVPNIKINQNGIIVGVYPYPFEDYSIHVKFDKMLDKSVIGTIQRFSTSK
jgi:CRP-like cAMP-binding protein